MAPEIAPRRVRTGRTGSIQSAKKGLWSIISRVKDSTLNAESHGAIVSGAHAMSQACSAYAKLIEGGELEQRLKSIEKILRVSEDR